MFLSNPQDEIDSLHSLVNGYKNRIKRMEEEIESQREQIRLLKGYILKSQVSVEYWNRLKGNKILGYYFRGIE